VTTMSMAAALNRALADAIESDPDVVVFGEDVGALGGVFRVTDGLTARFGEDRCFDTPLAESGIVGTAVGMAMNGMRPVIEMQFDAFALPAFEQVVSHVAKLGNRTRGGMRMPLVIRIPFGGGIGGVEHHCDSSEAYYAHTPGLTVVSPSTPQDAYSLLRAAISSPDPVIFLEPKKLYWAKGEVDTSITVEIGSARIARDGTDVTLLAYGASVPLALEVAEVAAAEGRSIQVVDVRSLSPFDDATVTAAVKSTGRAVQCGDDPLERGRQLDHALGGLDLGDRLVRRDRVPDRDEPLHETRLRESLAEVGQPEDARAGVRCQRGAHASSSQCRVSIASSTRSTSGRYQCSSFGGA